MALNTKFADINPMTFMMQTKTRERYIQSVPASEIKTDFMTNKRAKQLHPGVQHMLIDAIIEHPGADAKTYRLRTPDGSPCAYFRAGQYVSVTLKIGDSLLTRPFSLCSSPKQSLSGEYEIMVKRNLSGFASAWILDNWTVGESVTLSDPQGDFCFEPLRDSRNVVALAGGSGLTPFLSMARAVCDGTEDFDLTILSGSRTADVILFRSELGELTKRCPKLKVVNILSDEEKEGFEHGFISAGIIDKYAAESYTVFVCGPEAMYRFVQKELEKLGKNRRTARRELMGVTKSPQLLPGYPADCAGKTFSLTVRQYEKEYILSASATEPLLVAIERAGIPAPSRCRSGECGWCRAKCISGSVFIPPENDGRRKADTIHGYIHPCVAFPVSDIILEVPGSDITL